MMKSRLERCFDASRFILTEGGVGQRIEHEFSLKPDADIMYAPLIYDARGQDALSAIYQSYLRVAEAFEVPILLMTNTRRAGKERMLRSKYKDKHLMRDYTCFLRKMASGYRCDAFIGGMMGSKGDAYSGTDGIETKAAMEYHTWQMQMFDLKDLDFLFAGIMPTLPEAIGMAKVMETSNLPYIISLMISSKGALLDGNSIHDAIFAIDHAVQRKPLCYMTNCVHPVILKEALTQSANQTALVKHRFCGIQANAVYLPPEKLDHSTALKTTSAEALAEHFLQLHQAFPLKNLWRMLRHRRLPSS